MQGRNAPLSGVEIRDLRGTISSVQFPRRIVRLTSIPGAPASLSVAVDARARLRVRADVPINVALGDSPEFQKNVIDLNVHAGVTSVRLQQPVYAGLGGVVVLEQDAPDLGIEHLPFLPEQKLLECFTEIFAWPGAATALVPVAFTGIVGTAGNRRGEAVWLRSISLVRTAIGTISSIELQDLEGGFLTTGYHEDVPTPAGRVVFEFDPLLRVSGLAQLVVAGSAEVATTLNGFYNLVNV